MAKYSWHNGCVPKNIEIKQVYGIIFSNDGRILLKVEKVDDKIKYSFAGGHPETIDKGLEDTLKREVFEEVNITITNPILVGYQKVDEEDGSNPFAQVRMVAVIESIGDIRPDLDNGKLYDRLLVPPKQASHLLQWGNVGYEQINCALNIASEFFNINEQSEKLEYV